MRTIPLMNPWRSNYEKNRRNSKRWPKNTPRSMPNKKGLFSNCENTKKWIWIYNKKATRSESLFMVQKSSIAVGEWVTCHPQSRKSFSFEENSIHYFLCCAIQEYYARNPIDVVPTIRLLRSSWTTRAGLKKIVSNNTKHFLCTILVYLLFIP